MNLKKAKGKTFAFLFFHKNRSKEMKN